MINIKLIAIFLAIVFVSCAAVAEEKPVLKTATRLGWGMQQDAQQKFYMRETAQAFADVNGMKLDDRHFNTDEEFLEYIENGRPNMAVVGGRDLLAILVHDYGYIPYISYNMLNLTKNRLCVFVRDDGPADNMEKLRGKRIAVFDDPAAYYALGEMIDDTDPAEYFSGFETGSTSISTFYMLEFGEVEAALGTMQVYTYLQSNNPGASTNLRRLDCGPEYEFLPILHDGNIDPELVKKTQEFLLNIDKVESLSKYLAIYRMNKIVTKTVEKEDFDYDVELHLKAIRNGWDKSFKSIADMLHKQGDINE